jgi:hypothetical protein
MNSTDPNAEDTGVADVRRVRESIARQHNGNLAEHVAESNRIAESLREKLRLGPTVQPPAPGRELLRRQQAADRS